MYFFSSFIAVIAVIALITGTQAEQMWGRQMPGTLNLQRRVIDGKLVYGSVNSLENEDEHKEPKPASQVLAIPPKVDKAATNTTQATDKHEESPEEDSGYIDTILGDGAQSKILDSVSDWLMDKARANPGCIERFVCETYRTGESLTGIPYLLMSITNAAVGFTVAEMFDTSINMKEITKAARQGRTVGSCNAMECDVLDGQLRTIGNYLQTIEEFVSSLFSSISQSISIGK